MKALRIALLSIGGLAVIATLISLIPSDYWALRALDLIRQPLALLLFLVAALTLAFGGQRRALLAAFFTAGAALQVWQVWPYWSIAPEQIAVGAPDDVAECFTVMSANVKMENTDYARMTSQIEAVDPDVLLLTETDQAWVDALAPALQRYDTVRTHPQPDTFGKVFASKITEVDTDIVERRGEETPSVFAVLQLDSGNVVEFIGLHPKAPLPGQNTDERDQSIMNAAERAGGRVAGTIAMGDFNDVPWSRTTSAFRQDGNWRDPRIGRGSYATFPSSTLPLGWPLDQIMIHGDLSVHRFEVLAANGSDHRALLGEFCIAPEASE